MPYPLQHLKGLTCWWPVYPENVLPAPSPRSWEGNGFDYNLLVLCFLTSSEMELFQSCLSESSQRATLLFDLK